MSQTIQIANGPSREELFDGLRLFSEKRQVNFHFEDHGRPLITLPTTIIGIEAEDGSGQSWNIKLMVNLKDLPQFKFPVDFRLLFNKKPIVCFKVYYSTKNRKGILSF